jgi:hypothetical protein
MTSASCHATRTMREIIKTMSLGKRRSEGRRGEGGEGGEGVKITLHG